jgi:8-hydroxy-5-deazaflavin:NADPH oxidoreductase
MHIAVIGAGNVGGTLGNRLAGLGHDVTLGIRSSSGRRPVPVPTAPIEEAVRGADVVILATPWGAATDALRAADGNEGRLDGVVLIDATNPVGPGLALDVGPNGESGAERLQVMVPRARVVKAFNTTGAENMADPVYGGEATVMFYAGNDADAKKVVHTLVSALGFDAVDAGPLTRARELERLAVLWISLAYGGMGRNIAFKLARR